MQGDFGRTQAFSEYAGVFALWDDAGNGPAPRCVLRRAAPGRGAVVGRYSWGTEGDPPRAQRGAGSAQRPWLLARWQDVDDRKRQPLARRLQRQLPGRL